MFADDLKFYTELELNGSQSSLQNELDLLQLFMYQMATHYFD